MVYGNRVIRSQRRIIGFHHWMEPQPLADFGQNRHAQLALAVRNHEVDRLGSGLFGRTDEVAFVFAIFGVDNDGDLAQANRLDSFFDSGKTLVHVGLRWL